MQKPEHILEIFLQPGEYYFGDRETRLRTILGSCVSMTFWHPKLLLGGMSHIMLPARTPDSKKLRTTADAKYADEAMELLLVEMKNAGTSPKEYQVKLFGGGDMFSKNKKRAQETSSQGHVGSKNVDAARSLLKHHGFICQAEHLGGLGHRYIIFDIWSGDVWVKYQDSIVSDTGSQSGIAENPGRGRMTKSRIRV